MRDGEASDRTWQELARVPAPVERRALWMALLRKTERPELFNGAVRGGELLDHDPTLVVRRTLPREGEPYLELITHACSPLRVELRRHGQDWHRAQALVEGEDGPCLVYEVDDASAARDHGGIDAAHAHRVLARLLETARSLDPLAV